jgi:anti-sigma factor RsiW
MDCRDFRSRYSAYRDGHDPELAAEMDDHLEGCGGCASYDRAVREGVAALREEIVTPSSDFMVRLETRLASGEPVPEPIPPRVSTLAATVGAALFIALVVLTLEDIIMLPTPVAAEAQPLVVAQPRQLPGPPFIAFERLSP